MKQEVSELKEKMKVSMNSIYQTAIIEYVEIKKREQVQEEALEMISEYETIQR